MRLTRKEAGFLARPAFFRALGILLVYRLLLFRRHFASKPCTRTRSRVFFLAGEIYVGMRTGMSPKKKRNNHKSIIQPLAIAGFQVVRRPGFGRCRPGAGPATPGVRCVPKVRPARPKRRARPSCSCTSADWVRPASGFVSSPVRWPRFVGAFCQQMLGLNNSSPTSGCSVLNQKLNC